MFKKILVNTGSQLASRGLSLVVSLIVTALLTRILKPQGYGQYVFLYAWINLAITFANWGTNIIGVRELAKTKKTGAVYGSLMALKLTLGLIAILLGAISVFILPVFKGLALPASVGLTIVFATIIELGFEVVFQTKLKMGAKAIVNSLYSVVFLVTTLILLKRNFGINAPLLGSLLGKIVLLLVCWILVRKTLKQPIKVETKIIERLIKESLPMGMLLVLFATYDQAIDSLIIKQFLGSEKVGFYGLAYRIYANLTLPAYFFSNSIFPIISKNPKKNFKKATRLGYLALLGFLLFLIPTTIILSPTIIKLLSGPEFKPAIMPLKILSLTLIFSYLNHLNGFSLIALGKQRDSLKIGMVSLLTNLVLNITFIPKFGIVAAAIITLITEGVTSLIGTVILAQRKRQT